MSNRVKKTEKKKKNDSFNLNAETDAKKMWKKKKKQQAAREEGWKKRGKKEARIPPLSPPLFIPSRVY